jgi:hypothetical protein
MSFVPFDVQLRFPPAFALSLSAAFDALGQTRNKAPSGPFLPIQALLSDAH